MAQRDFNTLWQRVESLERDNDSLVSMVERQADTINNLEARLASMERTLEWLLGERTQ